MLQGYLTIAEAARALKEPEHSVRKRIATGELEATRAGWMWLIPVAAVEHIANKVQVNASATRR